MRFIASVFALALLLFPGPSLAQESGYFDSDGISFFPNQSVTIQPEDADDGYGGQTMCIRGAKGSPGQRGGNLLVEAGSNGGDGSLGICGGDTILQGGAPDVNGLCGGDVILRCHPSVTDASCGLDLGYSTNTREILFGHPPQFPFDLNGIVSFLGRVKSSIYFAYNVAGIIASDQAAPGSTAPGNTYSAGQGGTPTSSSPGGKGGTAKLLGALGGHGTAEQSPGPGGDADVVGGNAGTVNGTGFAFGGTVNVKAGLSSGGAPNGAINVGFQGPPPSVINIGQPDVPIVVHGYTPKYENFSVITADFSSNFPSNKDLVIEINFGNIRAVYLPAPSTLGIPSGKIRSFTIKVDGSISGYTLYIYAHGGALIDGSNPFTSYVTMTTAWSSREFFTDGTNYYSR